MVSSKVTDELDEGEHNVVVRNGNEGELGVHERTQRLLYELIYQERCPGSA